MTGSQTYKCKLQMTIITCKFNIEQFNCFHYFFSCLYQKGCLYIMYRSSSKITTTKQCKSLTNSILSTNIPPSPFSLCLPFLCVSLCPFLSLSFSCVSLCLSMSLSISLFLYLFLSLSLPPSLSPFFPFSLSSIAQKLQGV